jgi:hypothetical protein
MTGTKHTLSKNLIEVALNFRCLIENQWHYLHSSVPASSAQNAAQLLHEHLCKTTAVYKFCDTECKARLNSVNWYPHGAHTPETDLKPVSSSGEAWVHPSRYVAS